MYVPYYDPSAVYGEWPYTAYPPYYFGYPSYLGAGVIAEGEKSIEAVGREIFETVLRVASGEKTCAERLGHKEFVPWRIGPVL